MASGRLVLLGIVHRLAETWWDSITYRDHAGRLSAVRMLGRAVLGIVVAVSLALLNFSIESVADCQDCAST
jgi:hypothetical protein